MIEERSIAAVLQDFKQLNEEETPGNLVLVLNTHDELTNEEKRKSLEALNMINEKK